MSLFNRDLHLSKMPLGDRSLAKALLLALPLVAGTCLSTYANPQPIEPAPDGTGTLVTPEGDRFNIHGGTRAGENLFHSFDRFGLDASQVANFLSQPGVQNILGRVTGGEASIVNGLLQVAGSHANLFLMNPAGIVLGPDASLNVMGDFTATTATGIGFGESGIFDAFGAGNWGNLVGTPTAFRFDAEMPGRLVNLGDLAVAPGRNLSLLGGVVVSGGTLTAPEGKVTIAAVNGGNELRLSAEGQLLSLEIPVEDYPDLMPRSIAELLTVSDLNHASELSVNAEGTVVLSGSEIALPEEGGDAIVTGAIDVAGDLGGNVYLLGTRVGLFDGEVDATGRFGGGTVLVGGDREGKGVLPNAQHVFVGRDASIDASATEAGDGGSAIVFAEDSTQVAGEISARGGLLVGNGGFVETSGLQSFEITTAPDVRATIGIG